MGILLPRLRALAFIVRVAQPASPIGRLARWLSTPVHVDADVGVPTRHGPMSARLFRPSHPARRTMLLVPGVHMDGIDEERLVGLARELAASGMQVLTVVPDALTQYRISPNSADQLEDAIAWTAARPELAPDGKVGITGFSFAGGLALVAAGRPAVRDRVAFAFSFGGHADLLRVLRYLCAGHVEDLPSSDEMQSLAEGGKHLRVPKPNEYGAAVSLLNLADHMVPPDQIAPLQDAITIFLRASSMDRIDHVGAARAFAQARQLAEAMPEPARTLMTHVNQREAEQLGQALSALLAELKFPAAVSPEESPPPSAPVFLIHGADDSVVPASEMILLARKLEKITQVRAFASRLISHVGVNPGAALSEMWRLAGFWRDLMSL